MKSTEIFQSEEMIPIKSITREHYGKVTLVLCLLLNKYDQLQGKGPSKFAFSTVFQCFQLHQTVFQKF